MSLTHRRLLVPGRRATAPLLGAVALGVSSAALAVAQAGLLAAAVAGAVDDGLDVAALAAPLGWLALVLVARAALGWGSEVVAQRISGGVKAGLRLALLERAVRLGPRWASTHGGGDLVLLATRGLDALDGYYGRYLPQLGLAAIVPVAVIACLLVIDLVAGLTVALTVPLIPVFMVLIGRMSAAHRARRWRMLSLLAGRFADVVAGLPTLRAFGAADAQVAILRGITDRYRATTLATLRVAFLSALALELLATISVALVALGVGLRLVEGSLDLRTGLFALILAPEAYLPLRRLGAEFHASEEGLSAATDAFAVIDAPLPGGAGREAGGEAGQVVGTVEGLRVEALSVAQPGREVRAPAAVSFEARPGELVALTGPSGAGKSALLAVILGLVPADEGRVIVRANGAEADVATVRPEAWRERCAWVPQGPWQFAGTVADNVRLGAPDATDDEVRGALDAVGLRDVRIDRTLGERGSGLSSGQRRRVGVARALVRRAPVLLLDEPTAGLDAAAEATVLRALRTAADNGAIVLLVAHRPGAVACADRTVEVRWEAMPPEPVARPRAEAAEVPT